MERHFTKELGENHHNHEHLEHDNFFFLHLKRPGNLLFPLPFLLLLEVLNEKAHGITNLLLPERSQGQIKLRVGLALHTRRAVSAGGGGGCEKWGEEGRRKKRSPEFPLMLQAHHLLEKVLASENRRY